MLIDLNKTPPPQTDGYDICICGAGVAGITIALRAAKNGKKVALFEGGGVDYSKESQSLYSAFSARKSYELATNGCRLRYLGGTSNHWSGRCRPFEKLDFEERDIFDLPGWPIAYEEMEKYTRDANLVLELDENQTFPLMAGPESWQSDQFIFDRPQWSPPTRFKDKYIDTLRDSTQIDLFINANLTDIILDTEHSHVKSVKIETYKDKAYNFSGKQTILAMGAIENARLLLNSNKQLKAGIGNHSDFVGRCFMEHFNVRFGDFISTHEYMQPGKSLSLFTTEAYSRANEVGSSNISFEVDSDPDTYGRTALLKKALRNVVCKSETITELTQQITEYECPGAGLIGTLTEQAPNRESRVRLSDDVQAFGLRNQVVDLRINDIDKKTMRTNAIEASKEFARLGFGRVQLADFILDEAKEIDIGAHCHQMGTTRMSADPAYGVVDKNCKVFGLENLYISGSSVFSTGGGNNPTYPLVQLSLRLADHLTSIS